MPTHWNLENVTRFQLTMYCFAFFAYSTRRVSQEVNNLLYEDCAAVHHKIMATAINRVPTSLSYRVGTHSLVLSTGVFQLTHLVLYIQCIAAHKVTVQLFVSTHLIHMTSYLKWYYCPRVHYVQSILKAWKLLRAVQWHIDYTFVWKISGA